MRLRQVIVNLLSNGIKFTREGGVTVRASVLTVEDGRCALPLPEGIRLEDGQWLAVSVEDTGIGIAPEHFRIIFDAFRQIDGTVAREYQGTGLGLAITRQLVEMHSGKLWVESEQGRGSVFTFVLPIRSGMISPAQGSIPADGAEEAG
jgi:signal transduction histidine kinase